MQTFVRLREQIHSNLGGLQVTALNALAVDRTQSYQGGLRSHTGDQAVAAGQSTRQLGSAVA